MLIARAALAGGRAFADEVLDGVKATSGTLVVRSLNLAHSLEAHRGDLVQSGNERISAIVQNHDRSLNVVRTSTQPEGNHRAAIRNIGIPGLITVATGTRVAGLAATDSISSLLTPMSGPPIALVAHYTDTPPFSLVALDEQSGKVRVLRTPWLEPATRYSHLTQCPDGEPCIAHK